VAADIAGYSRLMGLDEVGTARTLREHRAVSGALVAKHGGRIVKTTGDGVLLEFPSVVDAVECAVAVQGVMAERNDGIPQDRRMLYRIGINLGDILIEGDDILGDGVNVAARLEGIAEPGGISIIGFAARLRSSLSIWASRASRISTVPCASTQQNWGIISARRRPLLRVRPLTLRSCCP